MREIIIDTAAELLDHSPTGRTFHCYLNPERTMPADAVAVHGLTAEFLPDKPPFDYVADEFLAFVGDAPLVAHNAGFDIAFLNAELKGAGKPPIVIERVIDTLVLARRKHADGLTLDDLCARYGVDRSRRTQHGDCSTPSCWPRSIELTTTRQATLQLEPTALAPSDVPVTAKARPQPVVAADDRVRPHRASGIRGHAWKRGDLA